MDKPNQRVGSVSNTHVGTDFELVAMQFFARQGIALLPGFGLGVGLGTKKEHCFDLGSCDPKMIVECKSHTWTSRASGPSKRVRLE